MPDGSMKLTGVKMGYRRGPEEIPVFDDFHLEVAGGDFLALMGPSGSGKTTLLNLVGGLMRPLAGQVVVGGTDVARLGQRQLARWRANNLGFIFQFYNLMPVLTAAENVELPLLLKPLSAAQRRERVETALSIVDLTDRARHRPSQLSGGQQQRVAIARAIVADPPIILADEPTGDLDRHVADDVLRLLQMLNRQLGKTIVMVTHDPEAADYARRTLHLDKGIFVEHRDQAA